MNDQNQSFDKLDIFLKANAPLPPDFNKQNDAQVPNLTNINQRHPPRWTGSFLAVAIVLFMISLSFFKKTQIEHTVQDSQYFSEMIYDVDSLLNLDDDFYSNWENLAESVSGQDDSESL